MFRIFILSLVLVTIYSSLLLARDRTVIRLRPHVIVNSRLVRLNNIADIVTTDNTLRKQIGDIDIGEFTPKSSHMIVTKQQIFYRLQLAHLMPSDFIIDGSDHVHVSLQRRIIRHEEIVRVARDSLLQSLSYPVDAVDVELALPIHVPLPEIAVDDQIRISARPHVPPRLGRVQMDVTIHVNQLPIISFAVHFNVRLRTSSEMQSSTSGGSVSSTPVTHFSTKFGAMSELSGSSDVVIRAGQRVTLVVQSGALRVTAIGESLEHGRFGQMIRVQNVDSKKVLSGRVVGPATVEVDLGVNR